MKSITIAGLLCLLLSAVQTPASAQNQDQAPTPHPSVEQIPLTDVLETVRKKNLSFLIDRRVPPTVVVGQIPDRDITYSTLLQILRNNGLAAVTVGKNVNIVPVEIIRQLPLPVIHEQDDAIDDEEWVTWVVAVTNAPPQSMVPILRPIMPKAGHLAANPLSNSLLVVDRYGNAKRVVALIRELDGKTPQN